MPQAGHPPLLAERAPAKVNLTLHVRGRREDGYHDLLSLVAFAGAGDRLELVPGPDLSISVQGPTAVAAGPDDDNLVIKAARLLCGQVEGLRVGAFRLVKRLPVAAGLGGGSSDAAAALRLLARLNGLSPDDPRLAAAARGTGSDVSVCLDPVARIMAGAGERVGPRLGLAPLFAVLVNPRRPVPTPAVFSRLGLARGAPNPADKGGDPSDPVRWIVDGRNDLQAPALSVEPVVGEVLWTLAVTPAVSTVRMSGSGATCFALYPNCHAAARAARQVRARRPDWWVVPTVLR